LVQFRSLIILYYAVVIDDFEINFSRRALELVK